VLSAVPIGALFFATCVLAALAPIRRPRRLAVISWMVGMVPNELPVVFLVIIAASWAPPIIAGDVSTVRDWVALGIAVATSVGLLVLARRTLLARPALDRALDDGLGADWRALLAPSLLQRLRRHRRRRWWTLLVPWPFRPGDVERVANVPYGPHGKDNLLDVYRHRSHPAGAPTIIHLHGGRFRWGRKSREGRPLLYRLARQGWTCISANYHRSPTPGEGFPQHLVDVKRLLAWARSHGDDFGIDPAAIVLAGSSAGAHLTAMAALTANQPRYQPGFEASDTSISAAIGLYGYYGRLGGADDPTTSPLDHLADAAPPPFLLVHGTTDTYTPVEGARALAAGLRRASSNVVVLAELPGAQHSFDVFRSVRFEAVVDAVGVFVAWLRLGTDETTRATGRRDLRVD
jgi:acetyl esterase/lipase